MKTKNIEQINIKMGELLDKIKLFRTLNLRPISEKEHKRWMCEIEKNLIVINNVKRCYVLVEQIKTTSSNCDNQKQTCGRVLRLQKKKQNENTTNKRSKQFAENKV